MMLTIQQVAQALGMGELTIRKKIANGEIKAGLYGRVYRLSVFDVNKYIVENGGTPLSDEDVQKLQTTKKHRVDYKGK
jgi:excisionase family DNA binding protein